MMILRRKRNSNRGGMSFLAASIAVSAALLIATGINAFVISSGPLKDYVEVEDSAGKAYAEELGIKDVKFIFVESITSDNGFIHLHDKSKGYVNSLASEDIVYMETSTSDKYLTRQHFRHIMMHEYGHILQMREIRAKSGGNGPSKANLFSSLDYYYNLYQVNKDLVDASPPIKESIRNWKNSQLGMETSADCVSQAANVYFSNATYIGSVKCNDAQLETARNLLTTYGLGYDVETDPIHLGGTIVDNKTAAVTQGDEQEALRNERNPETLIAPESELPSHGAGSKKNA